MKALALLLLAACAAGGCASLADQIVEPSRDTRFDALATAQVEQTAGIKPSRWRTPDGVDLAYRMIPAADRGLVYTLVRSATSTRFHFDFDPAHVAAVPVRGTVVYLHGWSLDGRSMLPWALALADHGYRGIAVDLRNAGDSSKAPVGFGPREAADVAALLDHLRDTGELHDPVFLFGVSYGASTALFAEPALREHLAGIVAMEPYANAADAIRTMVPGMLADAGSGARMLLALRGQRHDAAAIEGAIVDANHRLGLDLAAIDLHAPVAQSQTCTLLLHGARDSWIPAIGSRNLAQAAPRVHYVELPDETHMSLPVRIDWLGGPIADWFDRTSAGHCEDLALPADPVKPASSR